MKRLDCQLEGVECYEYLCDNCQDLWNVDRSLYHRERRIRKRMQYFVRRYAFAWWHDGYPKVKALIRSKKHGEMVSIWLCPHCYRVAHEGECRS